MLKFIVPFALFALLGVFLFVGLQRNPAYVPSPLIGKPAPEFTLPSLHDANYPVASKELLGRPWVLNVWGTWCGGCREEHETLLAIARTQAVPVIGAARTAALVAACWRLGQMADVRELTALATP